VHSFRADDAHHGAAGWPSAYLELRGEQVTPQRVQIATFPFQLGRGEANDYRLQSGTVSKHHAVVLVVNARYVIRDLSSTNGTFVNGVRISEQPLSDGDIIHLGPSVEFCFCLPRHVDRNHSAQAETTLALPLSVSRSVHDRPLLRELIDADAIEIVYQPIVDLETRAVVGYEALARGAHPDLPTQPAPLFAIAESCGMAGELSRFCRQRAVERARTRVRDLTLFLNVHPTELTASDDSFLPSLVSLRAQRDQPLVLEIAEAAVTNVASMGRTRDLLANLGLEFAYDDFGSGQSRLVELTDVPPQYLKLDIHVIAGIETSPARQELVRALLKVVRGLGVKIVAEGVETSACAQTCIDLGCHLGQGFLFGRPGPLPTPDDAIADLCPASQL
jgi:EAL domain-containing protein (putative c-di-GMP-specific phosphodiesterase class I)